MYHVCKESLQLQIGLSQLEIGLSQPEAGPIAPQISSSHFPCPSPCPGPWQCLLFLNEDNTYECMYVCMYESMYVCMYVDGLMGCPEDHVHTHAHDHFVMGSCLCIELPR